MTISVTIMTIVIIMIIIIFTDSIIIKKTHLSRSNASWVWILKGEWKQVLWNKQLGKLKQYKFSHEKAIRNITILTAIWQTWRPCSEKTGRVLISPSL